MKKYKIKCPYCKEEIIIKIDNEKIIEISHNHKEIDISEIPNNSIEFG